ncbi:UNVERIFIED_CONTAM: hypothetical protein RMT77_007652 [Armadillidium vulgare]
MFKTEMAVPVEERKLFVGGLGWNATEKEVNDYFSKFGTVESINLKMNPSTGRSRGFAFIVFANSDCIDQILNGTDHYINGRKIDPKKAIARTGKIFVGGLKEEISDNDIKNYFSQYGKIIDVKTPFDQQRNKRKGFCFITFEEEQVVEDLLRNPQQTICGISVDLRKVTSRNDAPYSGHIGGGGGGRNVNKGWQGGYGDGSYWGSPYSSYYAYDSNYGGGYGGSYNGGYDYNSSYDRPYVNNHSHSSKESNYQQSRFQPY